MTARERFEQLCADWSINLHGADLLEILDDARLRVIDQPEAAYLVGPTGPSWRGDGWAVTPLADGSVTYSTGDDDLGRHLPPEVVAAISAAHIRQGDYR